MNQATDFAAFVGIDWADQEHAVCLIEAHGSQFEHRVLPQQAEALDEWAAGLRERFGGRNVAVCLEQSRGALIYALMKYEFLVLFPINPKQAARYREVFTPSGAKDDPADAELLCGFLREHQRKLRAWRPDDATTRALRLLTEGRRKWVAQRTALGNQLLQVLKECYPLACSLIPKHVYAESFLKLLTRFSSQRELQRASPKQLTRYLPLRRRAVDDPPAAQDERIAQIRQAAELVTDAAVLTSGRLAVRHLAANLQQLNQAIAEYDQQIAAELAQHPDAELFATAPGAGPALTPRLVAAFGSDRSRFASAADLQQFSGVSPVTIRSGKSHVVRMRRACPRFLRQTFHEFARCSLTKSAWARAYCAMLRAKGHRYHSAVRALAYKWIRILFRCWQTRQPYDEERYLKQLLQKQSPLIAYLKTNPNP
jgi:transposase